MSLWARSRREGRGEIAAFEILWERHRDATYRIIARMLGNQRAHAEEICQDAWLEVARAERYTPGSFRAYIRTIATRRALDRLASAAVRTAAPAAPRGEDRAPTVPDGAAHPERRARAREGAALVLEVAAGLPAEQRVAWTLRYVEELTFEEVAAAMTTPVGTAKSRVRRANEFIAEELRGRGVEMGELELEQET